MFTQTDYDMMALALRLAQSGRFSTSPNPRVGCVLAHGNQIVGQGFHLQAGGSHAEVHALRQAGNLARGATAYVTLEPCSHYGHTPPCADALIEAGVARVIAAMQDPNPLVAGKGLAKLRAAGIQTASGLLEDQARAINRGFISRMERKRPFVRLKCAASLDGKTALSDGSSQWITGSEARADVQILRAESCAVLTGIGTVLADNPRLTVRDFPVIRHPARIVLDSRLRIPSDSHLLSDAHAPTIIATLNHQIEALNRVQTHPHVRIIHPQSHGDTIDLAHLLTLLAENGIGELLLETGTTLSAAFLTAGLVDEIVLYQSPKILGETACGLFRLPENPEALTQPAAWQTLQVETVGEDIKWTLVPRTKRP